MIKTSQKQQEAKQYLNAIWKLEDCTGESSFYANPMREIDQDYILWKCKIHIQISNIGQYTPPIPSSVECHVSSVHRTSVECPSSGIECPSSVHRMVSSVHQVSVECPSLRGHSTNTQWTLDRHSMSLGGHSMLTRRTLDRHSTLSTRWGWWRST